MDALAEEGAVFLGAVSSSSWTKPAIPSLFTGIWPTTHRVGAATLSDRLPVSVPMVQERFAEAGWATGSFSSSPLGSTLSALDRGFSTALPPRHWGLQRSHGAVPTADELHDALFDWWAEQARPVFAYVHTLDVHQYYLHDGQASRDPGAYREAVTLADTAFGEFMTRLRSSGHGTDTLVVLTSDHGESFGDHGHVGHGTGLSQAQLAIPLVFWMPGTLPAQAHTDPVSLIDVAPTLLDLAGLTALPAADGQSLRPMLQGGPAVNDWVAASLMRFTWTPGAPQQFATLDRAHQKTWRTGARDRAFDLSADPCERFSSAADATLLSSWLADQTEAAESFRAAHGEGAGSLDAGQLELLRTLGYVE